MSILYLGLDVHKESITLAVFGPCQVNRDQVQGGGLSTLPLQFPSSMPDCPGHYHRHRFPAEVISYAVWLYHRFALSLRDVEELLLERGIVVTYETIRAWVEKFGKCFAAELRCRERRPGWTWHLDEVFVRIRGKQAARSGGGGAGANRDG